MVKLELTGVLVRVFFHRSNALAAMRMVLVPVISHEPLCWRWYSVPRHWSCAWLLLMVRLMPVTQVPLRAWPSIRMLDRLLELSNSRASDGSLKVSVDGS